jgi:hypothetical protein
MGYEEESVKADAICSTPGSDNVASRAEGRPPEERTSDDPEAQAEVILQESEDRTAEGADRSDHP